MYNSTLKRKTPLQAKTKLTTRSAITRNTSSGCRKSSMEKTGTRHEKSKKKVCTYKPSYKYWSIFTSDLKACFITGDRANVHVHHIFGAANKANSEKYGFLLPLRADWHDMADYGIHFNKSLDLKYKTKCQDYWLKHYGTEQEFIDTFGKWWTDSGIKSA